MFYREYMDYHSDRFVDHSLVFLDKNENILGLLPANLSDCTLYSHQGLTFGSVIIDDSVRAENVIEMFSAMKEYCARNSIEKIIYKCIPYIYHTIPADEDRYALFLNKAYLFRRDISSTIYLGGEIRYSKGRKSTVKKAQKENLKFSKSEDYEGFWQLLEGLLNQKYGRNPAHNVGEIKKLAATFPENIHLYLVHQEEDLMAGAVLFNNTNIVHTQYLASSERGKEIGALDYLVDHLIIDSKGIYKYFDFGISNENDGLFLNKGLILQKEGFGARAVVHDFYELNTVQ